MCCTVGTPCAGWPGQVVGRGGELANSGSWRAERVGRQVLPLGGLAGNAKNVAFFYKERSVLFTKNTKEHENVSFF